MVCGGQGGREVCCLISRHVEQHCVLPSQETACVHTHSGQGFLLASSSVVLHLICRRGSLSWALSFRVQLSCPVSRLLASASPSAGITGRRMCVGELSSQEACCPPSPLRTLTMLYHNIKGHPIRNTAILL